MSLCTTQFKPHPRRQKGGGMRFFDFMGLRSSLCTTQLKGIDEWMKNLEGSG